MVSKRSPAGRRFASSVLMIKASQPLCFISSAKETSGFRWPKAGMEKKTAKSREALHASSPVTSFTSQSVRGRRMAQELPKNCIKESQESQSGLQCQLERRAAKRVKGVLNEARSLRVGETSWVKRHRRPNPSLLAIAWQRSFQELFNMHTEQTLWGSLQARGRCEASLSMRSAARAIGLVKAMRLKAPKACWAGYSRCMPMASGHLPHRSSAQSALGRAHPRLPFLTH